ncbi:MAG: hypothetical protein ACLPXB_08070 [Thiobacillaceae bacterium]
MRRFTTSCLLICSLLSACTVATSVYAQQPLDSAPPKPAARSIPPISDINNTPDDSQTPAGQLQPDTTPLTGLLTPTLGTPVLEHSFVLIGAQVGSTIQSSGLGSSGWYANNYFLGNLTLVKNWRQALTSINYSGGGYVSTDSSQGNGAYQNFSFFQDVRSARWDLSLVDVFAYVPQSQFGFGGGTNLGQPGTGSSLGISAPGVGASPSQDIFTAEGTRYTNTAVTQANYTLTARDSLTFSGSYGLLRFSDSVNSNNDTITGGMGYNRQLTKADTLGLYYGFSAFHYSGSPQAFGSHSTGLAYGRKITGRLALQISGGPQINTYRIPIGGSSSALTGYGSAILSYGLQSGNITLTYRHGLSNGSGVLIGSRMDQVTLAASHKLGRVLTGFANFGYSRNSTLGHIAGSSNTTYNDWFLGAGLSRPFGRDIQFGLAYTADLERSNQPGCTGTACNTDFTQHMVTLSLQWHARPFVLH